MKPKVLNDAEQLLSTGAPISLLDSADITPQCPLVPNHSAEACLHLFDLSTADKLGVQSSWPNKLFVLQLELILFISGNCAVDGCIIDVTTSAGGKHAVVEHHPKLRATLHVCQTIRRCG